MLEDHHIKKFQQLYRDHFDEDISKEHAQAEALQLLGLLKALYTAAGREATAARDSTERQC